MKSPSPKTAGRPIGVVRLVFMLLWYAFVLLIPTLGVWAASSLAAYRNGPTWLVSLCGLLLFPVLPLVWELRATAKRVKTGPRVLTFSDRIILRTLALNLVFLGGLLAAYPATAFAALATRGDWFLEGKSGRAVDELRRLAFDSANGLEWLYKAARPNPYEEDIAKAKEITATEAPKSPTPAARPIERPTRPTPSPGTSELPVSVAEAREEEPPRQKTGPEGWPLPDVLHPAVANMSDSEENSIDSVARSIAAQEPQPWLRLKALHDYVADRISYDVAAYRSGNRPPQDAETVFRTRRAVCAGYARLLSALGKAAGQPLEVVTGDARHESGDLTGESHAWNAAHVNGRWVLLDATWDAGYVKDDRFVKRYQTRYLFTPPEVQGITHFPEDPRWQMREPALTRGDFFRQPMLRADFFANGLRLLSPARSQVTVDDSVDVRLQNPEARHLLSHYIPREGGPESDCKVESGAESRVRCDFAAPGVYRVQLFAARDRREWHALVGEIEVVSKGRG